MLFHLKEKVKLLIYIFLLAFQSNDFNAVEFFLWECDISSSSILRRAFTKPPPKPISSLKALLLFTKLEDLTSVEEVTPLIAYIDVIDPKA